MAGKRAASIVSPTGGKESDCGYCKQEDTSMSYGMWAYHLTCSDYQQLIDRGWRRSGKYLYKPDLPDTCCPQYTIRLNSHSFKPSKSHKKVLKKVVRYLKHDWEPPSTRKQGDSRPTEDEEEDMDQGGPSEKEGQLSDEKREQLGGRHKVGEAMVLDDEFESGGSPGLDGGKQPELAKKVTKDIEANRPKKHKGPLLAQTDDWSEVMKQALKKEGGNRELRIVLERATFEEETFNLYCRYQKIIHNDTDDELTPRRYKGFLVDSPLIPETVASQPNFPGYGSFHQKYYLDGHLLAVGVIDILPHCVSSVYFLYDPDFSFLTLGVFSALQEISFAVSLSKIQPFLNYYYLGFYIHSCVKMRYKAQYKPSELLDPVAYQWVPLDACVPLLDEKKYTTFLPPADGTSKKGGDKPEKVTDAELAPMMIFHEDKVVQVRNLILDSEGKAELKDLYRKVGPPLARRIIVALS